MWQSTVGVHRTVRQRDERDEDETLGLVEVIVLAVLRVAAHGDGVRLVLPPRLYLSWEG